MKLKRLLLIPLVYLLVFNSGCSVNSVSEKEILEMKDYISTFADVTHTKYDFSVESTILGQTGVPVTYDDLPYVDGTTVSDCLYAPMRVTGANFYEKVDGVISSDCVYYKLFHLCIYANASIDFFDMEVLDNGGVRFFCDQTNNLFEIKQTIIGDVNAWGKYKVEFIYDSDGYLITEHLETINFTDPKEAHRSLKVVATYTYD